MLRKHSTDSTTQGSQPAQAAKQVRADQSATTQASGQSWLEPARRRAFIQLVVLSERTNEIEICPAYKNFQPFTKISFRTWCDVVCILLFILVLSISSMHAASALFSSTMSLLAPASRQVALRTIGPLCPLHSFAFCSILPPCERA